MLLVNEMNLMNTAPMDAWGSGMGFTIKCAVVLGIILIIAAWKLSR